MLKFKEVEFSYPADKKSEPKQILAGFELEIRPGQIASILGLSGRGKTTVGRLALGLETPTRGSVVWNGRSVEACQDRMGAVFQDYSTSLFRWLSVERNVLLGAEGYNLTPNEKSRRVRESLSLAGLSEDAKDNDFLKRKVGSLSGGQAQRVAIARAIIREPDLLVLDEPFASLDSVHRRALQETLVRLSQVQGFAAVLVTHDIDEAILVGDAVVVLMKRHAPTFEKLDIERHARIGGEGLVRSQEHELYASRAFQLLQADEKHLC